MPGICGYLPGELKKHNDFSKAKEEGFDYFCIQYNGKRIVLNTVPKFNNDKCCVKTSNYIVVVEGVILNLNILLNKFGVDKIEDLIIEMYKKNGEQFFAEFRGNFAGYFEDISNKKAMLFTSQTGEKTLFYHLDESGEIFFGSRVNDVKNNMLQCGKKCNLNITAAYAILTYAYMYDDITIYSEIKRLIPGHYLLIRGNQVEDKQYYEVKQASLNTISEEEAIEEIERMFKEAVTLQLKKNSEYGYDNYIPLSAGLDCRMTAYASKKILDAPMINFTYSETEQLDNVIPMHMANDLKNHWIFKSLDNGLALYNIEESTEVADGLIYYGWTSQLLDLMELLNTEKMGIVHTGVIGDVVVGTFFEGDNNTIPYQLGDGAYSKKLIHKLAECCNEKTYKNYETGMYYNRAFNGACLGYALPFGQFTEALSPFMNIDFMDFCMSLPLEYRSRHRLYYKWVKKYYPSAIKYSHNGIRIPRYNLPSIKMGEKKYNIESIPSLMKSVIKGRRNYRSNMNPMDYWYATNTDLKRKMDKYFEDHIFNLSKHQELKNDAQSLYISGTAIEKVQVISLLANLQVFGIS
ncbi:hypothetical protein [Extibacter muris]|uniref:hypothetical protein n=1 Tax=Extibacter muris TaxID=1796622 RepID=UPI001D06925D|nr:hypothetical protein [Extibacter muris]MCB6203683.1 hypothetical protein [Extibacter muris]MCQ4665237.1 hypothetical protein [Extibacter muris]MCQ4694651.1 hypothetical protein [Extibacter muris]